MVDVVSADVRSKMMAGIRGTNTKPEMIVRKGLHAGGFRFRLHDRKLPGKPDLVLPRYRAVIFVHGCFWHGHDCHLFKDPKTRPEFWKSKIVSNKQRDNLVYKELRNAGWRICEIWECSMKGRTRLNGLQLIESLARWLRSGDELLTIRGSKDWSQRSPN